MTRNRRGVTLLLVLLLVGWGLGDAATASATPPAHEASPAAADTGTGNVLQALRDSGVCGYTVLVLSFFSAALIVERFLTVRKARLLPPDILEELTAKLRARRVEDAVKLCQEAEASLLTDAVLAGLLRLRGDWRAAAREAGEEECARLYRKTEWLSMIAVLAPLIGLLGTVLGMVGAFNAIAATGDAARTAQLAGALGKALVPTCLGLCVAVPTVAALKFFRMRIDALAAEAGRQTETLLTPLAQPPAPAAPAPQPPAAAAPPVKPSPDPAAAVQTPWWKEGGP